MGIAAAGLHLRHDLRVYLHQWLMGAKQFSSFAKCILLTRRRWGSMSLISLSTWQSKGDE